MKTEIAACRKTQTALAIQVYALDAIHDKALLQVYTKLDLGYPTEFNDKNRIYTAEKSKTMGDVGSTISPASAIREVFPNQRACCAILQSPAEHMARMFLYSFTPPSSQKKIHCSYLITNKH